MKIILSKYGIKNIVHNIIKEIKVINDIEYIIKLVFKKKMKVILL